MMKEIEKQWVKEQNEAFKGWNFSHLNNRWQRQSVSWNYEELVRGNLSPSKKLLDMGTGGGEFLLSLGHPYENTVATESWQSNIELCQEKLTPLGITFCPVENKNQINLPANTFDIIINRHAEYSVKEIKRLLKPKGIFVTQQVGNKNCENLAERLNKMFQPAPVFSLETELTKFRKEGFAITQMAEEYPALNFKDVGAVVYFAKRIEWTFPQFSVKNNIKQLRRLQKELEKYKKIETIEHRFLLVAQKGP